MLVPTLPELFVMGFFADNPTFGWGLTLLAVVVAAEVSGNGILYLAARRFGLPAFIERKMRQWTDFLIVNDERIILVNRVAPIVPFVGAFIATMKWDVRRSFLYILVGGAAKYAILIALVGFFFVSFEPATARNVTLLAIVLLIAASFAQNYMARKKHLGPVASRVAHLGNDSRAPPAAGEAQREEDARHRKEPDEQ